MVNRDKKRRRRKRRAEKKPGDLDGANEHCTDDHISHNTKLLRADQSILALIFREHIHFLSIFKEHGKMSIKKTEKQLKNNG